MTDLRIPENADALLAWASAPETPSPANDWRKKPRKTKRFAQAAKKLVDHGNLRAALWVVLIHSRSKANRSEALALLDKLDVAP